MALHDVDIVNPDRGAPVPNAHDHASEDRMAHGTNSTNYVTQATPIPGAAVGGGASVKLGFKRCVGIIVLTVGGNASTLNTASAPHGILTYIPKVEADLEGATITTAGGSATGAAVPLPAFTSASIGGVTAGVVTFGSWLQAFTDATNVYVNLYNATGSSITVTVTCYLYQSSGL